MATLKTTQKRPDPCSFIIFGVTGDLAHRLVVPALYNLAATNLLPEKFCLVGVARNAMSNDELADSLMKGLREFANSSGGRRNRQASIRMRHMYRGGPERSGIL